MTPTKLTNRVLEKLKPLDRVRDTVAHGLFAEAGRTGNISLKFQADLREGPRNGVARKPVTVRMTLGSFPDLSVDAARNQATALLLEIREGCDPRVKRALPREVSIEASATGWTVATAFENYIADIAKRPGSDLTRRDMAKRLERT